MRKRKLYLSELLKRYKEQGLAVSFSGHYYNTVLECLQEIYNSETYWNAQVKSWNVLPITKVILIDLE